MSTGGDCGAGKGRDTEPAASRAGQGAGNKTPPAREPFSLDLRETEVLDGSGQQRESSRPPERSQTLDRATLVQAQVGDRDALQQVVACHQGRVWSLVWRVLGSRAEPTLAEDVTQDALLRVLRSLPRFDPEGPALLSTWVLTIATRTVVDALRERRPEVLSGDTAVGPAPMAYRPDWQGERVSLGREIAAAVDTLSPEVRATFVLRAYHDLDYAEIADALQVDLGTVKSRLSRARAQLRERLTEVAHDWT